MRGERRIHGTGDRMQFKSSTDGKWYRIQDADMAHLTDAVKYWNQKGGYYGPKSREVRAFMRDSRKYELEYYGTIGLREQCYRIDIKIPLILLAQRKSPNISNEGALFHERS
jgi:hypothetical protein